MAAYLARIEEIAFAQNSPLIGWERYKTSGKHRVYYWILIAATTAAWLTLIIGSFWLSISLSMEVSR